MSICQLSVQTSTTDSPPEAAANEGPELSVVMPCLNEAETLTACITKTLETLQQHGIDGEVVIADNGSTDGSQALAASLGARVVAIPRKGYGNALWGGIAASRGRYVIMGDSDDSYDFRHIPRFLEKLREGNDLVMGNRFTGGILPGAMPPLHQYFGNPLLTSIGRLFFRAPCGDFYCGLRGFRRESVLSLDLRTTGMEFAYEMIIKATLHKMRISEVPTTLSPDGRGRPPHLRSWHDGWRTLRFMLLFSPRWLFLYPGTALAIIGGFVLAWTLLFPGAGSANDVRVILFAGMMILLGFQSILFAVFSKVFALASHLVPPDPRLDKLWKVVTLETGLIAGALVSAIGVGGMIYSAGAWASAPPGDASPFLRPMIASVFATILGFQTIISSFFLSVLGLARK